MDELLLHRYLENRLTAAERLTVDELLRRDPAARRTLDALREEERLIRLAFEPVAEPSRQLSNSVLVAIYNEERARVATLRQRRFRRHALVALAAAACLVLAMYLVKGRQPAATVVCGTGGTIITSGGEKEPLSAKTRVFSGDQVQTSEGQFVRLSLPEGGILDLDEGSLLEFERASEGVRLKLDAGRMGVNLKAAVHDLALSIPEGALQIAGRSEADVWLPQPSGAVWPELLVNAPDKTAAAPAPNACLALTVIRGSATIGREPQERLPRMVEASCRGLYDSKSGNFSVRKVDLEGSHVLDERRPDGWHTAPAGAKPRDRDIIGLLNPPDFADLGRRLGLTEVPSISDAIDKVQAALQKRNAEERANLLDSAEQHLRTACEPLRQDDPRRRFGRMMEGLALFECGRALSVSGKAPEACNAFRSAAIALEEALKGRTATGAQDWPAQLNPAGPAGHTAGLNTLSPAALPDLYAAFFHPVARYWQARSDPAHAAGEALNAAQEFDTLRLQLGNSVESLATLLGAALSYDAAARQDQAANDYQEMISIQTAGELPASRRIAAGFKQAALLSLVKFYAGSGQTAKAQAAAEDFWILYPLDGNTPVAQEIERAVR